MNLPTPLTIDDCPLLKKDPGRLQPVLDGYAEAVRLLTELRDRHPRYLTQPDVRQRVADLRDVADRLTRERYLVGFLGTSGAGKSATVNGILQAPVDERPSKEGNSENTTSVITRLRAIPAKPHTLRARYLSHEEYQHRRNTLCEWLGLPNSAGMTEEQIKAALARGLPPPPPGARSRQRLPDDQPYLLDLLQSYADNKDRGLVRPNSYEAPDPSYDQRDALLNHAPPQDANGRVSKYKLLAEAEIGFATDKVPAELEMVDCPGLGAKRSVDTLVTQDFIPKLDGALLFLRADDIFPTDAVLILQQLKEVFRDKLASRVWVVVNKFDVPTREAKVIGNNGRTVFDVIADLELVHGIPLSQVCLTCRDIYKDEDFLRTGRIDRDRALEKVKLSKNDPTSPSFARYPALAQAFEKLLTDGGIGNLQHLIKNVMAPSVARQIIEGAAARLQAIVGDLQYAVKLAGETLNQQDRLDAVKWHNAVQLLIYELEGRNDVIEARGAALKAELEKLFAANVHPAVLARIKPADLLKQYDLHARHVLAPALATALGRTVNEVYGYVTDRLTKEGLPPVELAGGKQPLDVWAQYCLMDRQDAGWQAKSMPRLHQPELLGRLVDGRLSTAFNGDAYQALMKEKIRLAVHQVMHAIRGQVRKRLRQLEAQLSRKIWTPEDELALVGAL